ncbi:MAG: WGR domain-containing protein [Gammaproteobacteria bacterium]|nr:WGR domain-containing protein [Gammaproteobacteria bacterium]
MQQTADLNHSPQFYQLGLEPDLFDGWNLVKEWGRAGASGRVQKEHYDSFEQAEKALIAARDRQLKKGYRIVFAQGESGP